MRLILQKYSHPAVVQVIIMSNQSSTFVLNLSDPMAKPIYKPTKSVLGSQPHFHKSLEHTRPSTVPALPLTPHMLQPSPFLSSRDGCCGYFITVPLSHLFTLLGPQVCLFSFFIILVQCNLFKSLVSSTF